MSDHCHHPNPYCPSCVDPITADDRIRLFPPPQKVFSAVVLAQYEAKVRELEAEVERLRGENERLRGALDGTRPYRCNDYPSCACPAYEACLVVEDGEDDY